MEYYNFTKHQFDLLLHDMENFKKGSVNDYTIFRETFTKFKGYLSKTLTEQTSTAMINDSQDVNWAIVGNKAYGGPSGDTEGVRRIFPKKRNQTTYNSFESRVEVNHPAWLDY